MYHSGVYTGDTTNMTLYLALAALALLLLIIIIFIRRRKKDDEEEDNSYDRYER